MTPPAAVPARRTPRVTLVVAATNDGVIGRDGGMPWHLPADLAHFKRVTMGHPIVMGRRTYASIGRALPGRLNVVVTRDRSFSAAGVTVAHSLDEALSNLEKDHEFLLKGDVFTKDVVEGWIAYKRKHEVDAMRLRPHPHEYELYFDI